MRPDPMLFRAQEHRRGRITQIGENSARQAIVYGRFTTSGYYGEVTSDEVFDFGLKFIEMPNVSYSYSVDGDLEAGSFPRCFGGVSNWRIDSKGMYTGAWGFVVVEMTGQQDPYDLTHFFTFQGLATKAVPAERIARDFE